MEEIREAMETTVTPEAPAEWWEGTSFEDAKAIIRSNMDNVARNSVAIGYYLRSIRDREQYREGGYQSFDAFVQAEYSMSYSAATRLIGLCERFSRGGNSPVLADTYQGYSKSLLVEMLPMSDAQLEQVQPGMTVAEVREIKREAREETMPEPEAPEEPEVVFQLAGEAETINRQEAVAKFEETMPAPVFEEDVFVQQEEPAGCVHDQNGACTVLFDPDVAQPCVEGPCPAEEPVATSQSMAVWTGLLCDMPMFGSVPTISYLTEEEINLEKYLEIDDLPEKTVMRKQMLVAGLRLLLRAVEEAEREES